MSLLLITGYPCSGKSLVADKLLQFLADHPDGREAVVVRDECASSFNREIYRESRKEIQQRSFLKAEVQRLLSPDRVVIFDSLNYVKGYRYEIYCLAKAAGCSYSVLFMDATEEECLSFNRERDLLLKYDEDILKALVARFELPASTNRWENPLIRYKCEEADRHLLDIVSCVLHGCPLKPNLSTRSVPITGPDFLYNVDKKIQEVVCGILAEQRLASVGDAMSIMGSEEKLIFQKAWSGPELARFKRQFISYLKAHPVLDEKKLVNMFITFVNNAYSER